MILFCPILTIPFWVPLSSKTPQMHCLCSLYLTFLYEPTLASISTMSSKPLLLRSPVTHKTKSSGQFSVLTFCDLSAACDIANHFLKNFLTWPLRQSLGFLFSHCGEMGRVCRVLGVWGVILSLTPLLGSPLNVGP